MAGRVTIYLNPACGTSPNSLAMIRATGVEPLVMEYLKTPPSRGTLKDLVARMGLTVRDVLREKGTPDAELGLGDPPLSDDALLDAVEAHPILMNRPVVVTPKGVRLRRPSETVLRLLDGRLPEGFVKEDGERVAARLAWAAMHLVVGLPLNRLVVPNAPTPAVVEQPDLEVGPPGDRRAMALLAFSFAATWMVSTAMAAHLPALLRAAGARTAWGAGALWLTAGASVASGAALLALRAGHSCDHSAGRRAVLEEDCAGRHPRVYDAPVRRPQGETEDGQVGGARGGDGKTGTPSSSPRASR